MKDQLWDCLTTFSGNPPEDYVHRRLELDYRYLLQQVHLPERALPQEELHGHIQLIIWGCMYIEGLANTKLYEITAVSVSSGEILQDYWRMMQRDSLEEKLKRIFRHYPWVARQIGDKLRAFSSDIELRNRLVHFKERPMRVNLDVIRKEWDNAGQPGEMLEMVPPPVIITEIRATPFQTRQDNYLDIGDVLETIRVLPKR